jgi:hypothetical protein
VNLKMSMNIKQTKAGTIASHQTKFFLNHFSITKAPIRGINKQNQIDMSLYFFKLIKKASPEDRLSLFL